MMYIWQFWNDRNCWVFEKKKANPMISCTRTLRLLGEFEAACERDETSAGVRDAATEQHTWLAPILGRSKLNTDAAVTKEGKVGLGMVVRDAVGDVLMIAGSKGTEKRQVLHAEADALLFGLRYSYDAGFRRLEVEVDNQTLAALVAGKTKVFSATQIVVNDIIDFAKKLEVCSFGFSRRTCNKVPHSMAKASLDFEEDLVWMEECPPYVLPFVQKDKASNE